MMLCVEKGVPLRSELRYHKSEVGEHLVRAAAEEMWMHDPQ